MDGHPSHRGSQIKIDLEKWGRVREREREKRNFFHSSSSIFRTEEVYYLVCTSLCAARYRVACPVFSPRIFMKVGGVRWQGNSPRGWRMFCNFSGLLVSRAVLLIETKFSPPWLIGRIRFFPFRIARICQVFFSFFFFFDFFVFFFFFLILFLMR